MPRTDTDKVRLAREIVAGRRSQSAEELYGLANSLREENQIGYARRVYDTALPLSTGDLHNKVQIKLALSTYKDPDLPIDERLKTAETLLLDLLQRSERLTTALHQETLGILGAVYKQRWSVYAQKEALEKSLLYYRTGYELGIESDLAYTAVNTAFVLDLLADAERAADGGTSEATEAREAAAKTIRERIVNTLPGLAARDKSLEDQWWFDCTLGEAYLGLRNFADAQRYMQKAAAQNPDNWRLESTARQIAHLVRLQTKADGLPLEQWQTAPGFAVLRDLLGGSAPAAVSFFLGKVGLALSGGGFRASLYHIGVLARLAELDMLRHVEVISSVSGGSILGAYYYLELRHLLKTKPDRDITRDDYVQLVRNVEAGFLEGVQRNIRIRMMLEPGSNWKVLSSPTSTTTDRLADLYERELYSRVKDDNAGARPRLIQDLLITPADTTAGDAFNPRYDNWRRINKVPILILNATTLNTCHNWQFTATFMGEPPGRAIDTKIDANDRLRRMYYTDAPPQFRSLRLGQAVAASACVPGLFDPLVLDRLYPEYAAKLVDGGVYDNQGAASLREQDCTVLLVSDASGQTAIEKIPGGDRIGVSLRANNVLMARSRQEMYQILSALTDAGLLRGVAYVHLKKDLDAEKVDWVDCPDPSDPEKRDVLTTYGVRKDLQTLAAAIRTDLDSFSDAEADLLMFSGYQMMTEEFRASIKGFPVVESSPVKWRFRSIEKLASSVLSGPELESLKRTLRVARSLAFKPYQLSIGVKIVTWLALAAAAVGLLYLILSARGHTVSIARLLFATVVVVVAGAAAKFLLRRVLRNPNPLWQFIAAIPMLILGWPLTWLWTRLIDPIYLRSGPRYRP
jgi:predicted acylesterase/phospholipase RssA